MAKKSLLGRFARRGLLIVLVALAGAVIYLWLFRGPADMQTFNRVYRASVAQASGSMSLAAALGVPLRADESAAHYKFYREEGIRHVKFRFPLRGPRRDSLIVGEAILLGHNWLIVRLVATFPGHAIQINLSPGIAI
jgi:hypothetical protein